jgi:hypothetical protein
MTNNNLEYLAEELKTKYKQAFAASPPPESSELADAIKAIYAQIPYNMMVETRPINPLQDADAPRTIAQELLSELPRLVLKSDLPATKKLALLNSIGDLYRKYTS